MSFSNVIQHKSSTRNRAIRNRFFPSVSGMIFNAFSACFESQLTRNDIRLGIFIRRQLAALRWFERTVPTAPRQQLTAYRSALVPFDEPAIT
jgi:hypothetical protein